MEAENQWFLSRLSQIPVVKAVSDRAVSVYDVAKNSNRLFNTTFQLAEDTVKYASEVEIVKKLLDNQLVTKANQVAVGQLDKIEHNYPSVNKTPDELWTVGKDYYEHSRLKNNVDKLYAAKNYGVTKIRDTKNYYQTFVADKLNGLLDFSDTLVDKYIVVQNEANGEIPHCGADQSYIGRVQCISGKLYHGVKYRAGEKYDVTKEYALKTLGDYHTAVLLIEYAKNTAAWANDKARATLTTAQEQAIAIWHGIQARAAPITGRSEAIALNLVQSLASNVAALSQQVAKYSSPYLPEGVEKVVVGSANYATELRDAFAKAKSLGDVRDEVIAEAKDKLGYVQEGITKGIDYLVEFPPISWIIPARIQSHPAADTSNKDKVENGHVDGRLDENGGY